MAFGMAFSVGVSSPNCILNTLKLVVFLWSVCFPVYFDVHFFHEWGILEWQSERGIPGERGCPSRVQQVNIVQLNWKKKKHWQIVSLFPRKLHTWYSNPVFDKYVMYFIFLCERSFNEYFCPLSLPDLLDPSLLFRPVFLLHLFPLASSSSSSSAGSRRMKASTWWRSWLAGPNSRWLTLPSSRT